VIANVGAVKMRTIASGGIAIFQESGRSSRGAKMRRNTESPPR
jgi:hypothetical protein